MTTTVELERAGTFEAIQYGTFEIQNGTSDGRLAPEARITTANSVPVESNQRVRIVIDGVTRFEGRTTSEGTRRGNGQRVVKCEHEAYRVFDEAVSVGPSNDTAFILSNAIGETSFGSFTVDYTGTSDILGGTYEAENRKVKQIFRDIADRVNRVFWVATDGTITVQPRGGRGEWTSVSLPGDRASIDEYEAGDVRSVINDVTVVGTREEKVEGSAVDSASISEYGRRSERFNLAYVTTTAEANDAAEQLLQPEPLDSAKLTVGSNVGTDPEQNLANYSITLTDPSLDLSSDTFLIESQTIEQGRVTLEVGEASRNSARSVNRKAKSNGDVTDLGNVVGSGQLGDQSVDTPQLVDTAVIEQKLADASVGSGKLVDASVIEQKLADASVGSGKLVDESVIEQKLANLSVSETKIQDDSISTQKIKAFAITANEIASRTITALEIDAGAITSNEIDTQTIVANNIAARTIDALRIESDAITANEIAADTITADEITSRTISALEIEAGTITANEIDAGTITANEVATLNLQTDQLTIDDSSTGASLEFFGNVNGGIALEPQGNISLASPFSDPFQLAVIQEIKPDDDNVGQVGTSLDAYSEMNAHNFITATPEPLDSVSCRDVTGYDWHHPPECVAQKKAAKDDDREYARSNPNAGIEMGHMTNWLLEVTKDQQRVIESLESTVDDLESRIEQLEAAVGPNA